MDDIIVTYSSDEYQGSFALYIVWRIKSGGN